MYRFQSVDSPNTVASAGKHFSSDQQEEKKIYMMYMFLVLANPEGKSLNVRETLLMTERQCLATTSKTPVTENGQR